MGYLKINRAASQFFNSAGWSKWKAGTKLGDANFATRNVVVATHFWSKMSSQSCRKCSAQLPPVLIEQLEIAWMNKKQADEALAKRACTMDSLTTVLNRPQSVSAQLSALARPHADAAI